MVIEFCEKGSLLDIQKTKKKFEEKEVSLLF